MEIAEYDGAGALLRRYIPGGAIDARVAWVLVASDGSETLEYYHADRQGSVIAMTDEAGAVSERYAYDPIAISFHCLLQETQCRLTILVFGDVALQHFAFVLHGSPKIVLLTVYLHESLIDWDRFFLISDANIGPKRFHQ